MSRKGRRAAPAISAAKLSVWGRCAPLSRHKAAPTRRPRYLGCWLISHHPDSSECETQPAFTRFEDHR
ncbi:hypothetical protein CMV24_05460 [Pseudomonas plecoglossicida]|uniref:Uncharacterized protein n=1 Tax=Pseudomonas plecoglossicida TaxID=70775 RepID=A0A2A3M8Q9_PSEDL|nr:hypothetical protein CMV24_05460 [Pseudomonas plecoglossicida]